MTENSDGFISSAKVYEAMDADGDGLLYVDENDNDKYDDGEDLYVTGTKKAEDGTVGLGGTYYAYSDDVVVARWTLEDDAIEISRINSVKNDTNDKVVAIMDGRVVIGLFIIEVKGGEEEVKLTDDVSLSSVTVKGIEASQSGDTYTVNVPSEKNIDGVTQLVVKATDSNAKISDLKIDGGKYTVDNTAFGKTGERVITFTVTSSDGTKTADYTVKATIGAACKVTISATNALVKVDGKAISGTVTYDQGEELILTIVPADGMKIKDVKWDEGTAIPGFSGEYRVTVPSSESATLNVTAEAISES